MIDSNPEGVRLAREHFQRSRNVLDAASYSGFQNKPWAGIGQRFQRKAGHTIPLIGNWQSPIGNRHGKVTFANAGHLQPLLVDSSGAQFLKTDAGLPLGIMECEFSEREVEMPAGSRLFLYTDGVTAATNPSLEEYRPARIREHVADPSSSVQSLLNDLGKFAIGRQGESSDRMITKDWDKKSLIPIRRTMQNVLPHTQTGIR